MEYDSLTAQYLQNLTSVGGLYSLAVASRAGLLNAYYDSIIALYEAQTGGLMYTGAAAGGLLLTAGLPVITMAGVFVALGSGYAEARAEVENENSRTGFAEGFVMGLLGWRGHQVVNLFGRQRVLHIYQSDEQLNVINVNAYNKALAAGFTAANALPKPAREGYLKQLRTLAGHPSTGHWTRNEQISFVIDLATTGLKKGVIKQ